MIIRLAAVQPRSKRGLEESCNLDAALFHLDQAAQAGAQLVVFPEGFPGPYNGQTDWSAFDAISAKARQHKLYIVYGTVDPADDESEGTFRLALKFVGPDGQLIDTYYRVQPNQPEVDRVLMGNKIIAPGERMVIHDSPIGRIGLLICSEVFCPELPRLLGLMGVDILVAPVGGLVYELADSFRCMHRARAIENLCYVVTCQHIYGMEDGVGVITGPEGILAERKDAGLIVADVDLDRLQWLRSQRQSLGLPKPYKVVPGLLHYRRPELYGPLTEPRESYDFYYYRQLQERSLDH